MAAVVAEVLGLDRVGSTTTSSRSAATRSSRSNSSPVPARPTSGSPRARSSSCGPSRLSLRRTTPGRHPSATRASPPRPPETRRAATPIVRDTVAHGVPLDRFAQSRLLVRTRRALRAALRSAVAALLTRITCCVRCSPWWTDTRNGKCGADPGTSALVRRVAVAGSSWPEVFAAERERAYRALRPDAGVMVQVVWFDSDRAVPAECSSPSTTWWWTGCRGGSWYPTWPPASSRLYAGRPSPSRTPERRSGTGRSGSRKPSSRTGSAGAAVVAGDLHSERAGARDAGARSLA